MNRFIKIFLVVSLYFYIVVYLKYFDLQPIFFLASLLFLLAITMGFIFKENSIVNICLLVALTNLAMIYAIFSNFLIGIIIFFILVSILFIYCYILITRKNKNN